MKRYILFQIIAFLFVSCNHSYQQKDEQPIHNISKSDTVITKNEILKQIKVEVNNEINRSLKEEMFCLALNHFSTAPFFVVITVKNLKTGQIKDICTEAPFVLGAIDYQYDYTNLKVDCDQYPNQYFEFSTSKALKNINFDLYTIQELDEYSKTLNIELIVQHVKEGKLHGRTFGYDYKEFSSYLTTPCSTTEVISEIKEKNWEEIEKEQIMFAHIMFNNGIMMTRGCVAGNCSGLYTVEQAKKMFKIP